MKYEYKMPEYGGGRISIASDGKITAELINIPDDDIEWDWSEDDYIYPSIEDWDWSDEVEL